MTDQMIIVMLPHVAFSDVHKDVQTKKFLCFFVIHQTNGVKC